MTTRILVIEDNLNNLELVSYLLKAFSYVPIHAHDGIEGLAMAEKEKPDLILCDIQLPKLDGYGVAKRIKANKNLSAIPLIAVTALAMVGDKEIVLKAGFDGYITKPIAPETFIESIEVFLKPELRSMRKAFPVSHSHKLYTKIESEILKNKKFLLVDDSQTNIELMETILKYLGCQTLIANTVQEALEILKNVKISVIISDIHLQGREKNGFELLEKIRNIPKLVNIPFIFISSTTRREEDRIRGLKLGANKFIFRPIEAEVLIAEILDCFNSHLMQTKINMEIE